MNTRGENPDEIIISKTQWKELMIITNDGIKKKLQSARKLADTDKQFL